MGLRRQTLFAIAKEMDKLSFAVAREIWINRHTPGIAERGQKEKERKDGNTPGSKNEGEGRRAR